ncbi:coenzyme F420-0:L-glutamate ligase [Candidatus Uhrbacteria bacterium]|nr:coenzyme F420-0:L-glutamate ligase [Candidatus Uhrbacteria bacterium]
MMIEPVKTRALVPPQDDLLGAIRAALPAPGERSIVAITSKVVSIWQGRCVPRDRVPDKDALIIREADKYLPRELVPGKWLMHTIKNNLFIPTAGIDESNASGHYILWPRDSKATARDLWQWLRASYHVRDIGVIITDSHTIPLRRGVLGISLAHYGFAPLRDYRGTVDIFGRKLVMTQSDIVDSLAAAAVLLMGEGAERTPLALITDVPFVQFTDQPFVSTRPFSSLEIEEKEDLYYPLLASVPWQEGGHGVDGFDHRW